MLCPNCGTNLGEQNQYCTVCGKNLSGEQEMELFSFGPWGINVCFGRPGTFVMMHKNDTKIMLTNRRVYGSSIHTNSHIFQVPYITILAKEVYDFRLNLGLWRVLWIKYQEPDKSKEVSIMSMLSSQNIDAAYDILQKTLSDLPH